MIEPTKENKLRVYTDVIASVYPDARIILMENDELVIDMPELAPEQFLEEIGYLSQAMESAATAAGWEAPDVRYMRASGEVQLSESLAEAAPILVEKWIKRDGERLASQFYKTFSFDFDEESRQLRLMVEAENILPQTTATICGQAILENLKAYIDTLPVKPISGFAVSSFRKDGYPEGT